MHSISTSLPFKMARVSTRAPYQPRPRTITTLEAAAILSSFTFLQLSCLHLSNSPMSTLRVVRVPTAERPSAEWRGRLRKRPGSKRPSVLSGSRVSARENQEYFYYRRKARTPHSVSWAEMAPKLTRHVPSPKTHSPLAQAAVGMYMTYHYQAHVYIAQWREQARNDSVERAYIEKMGLGPFVNMNWADPNSAPRMRLTEEFINGAVHQRSSSPPRPNGSRGRWEDVRDQRATHHPVPSPTDRRHDKYPGQTRVKQEVPHRVPRPGSEATGRLQHHARPPEPHST